MEHHFVRVPRISHEPSRTFTSSPNPDCAELMLMRADAYRQTRSHSERAPVHSSSKLHGSARNTTLPLSPPFSGFQMASLPTVHAVYIRHIYTSDCSGSFSVEHSSGKHLSKVGTRPEKREQCSGVPWALNGSVEGTSR